MRSKLYNLGLVTSSALAVFTLAVTPVYAQHGADDSTATTTSSNSDSTTDPVSDTGSSSESETKTEAEHTTSTEVEHNKLTVRSDAQKLLATKRQDAKEHTQAERQKACQARQNNINKRSTNYADAAQRHLDAFNKIFTRVQAFETKKQLNVTGYDALVSTATAKQLAAQTAVDTLKALDVKIDCTASDPASTVAGLKTAVTNARTALKDYRQSIKDVVVALKGASTADKSTTTQTEGN